jgi:hypothetical protein
VRNIFNYYQKIIGRQNDFGNSTINVQFMGDAASEIIKDHLNQTNPLMISRFGANEINIILNYIFTDYPWFKNLFNPLKGIPYIWRYKKGIIENLHNVAGFFPIDRKSLDDFVELSINDIKEIDILGSWLNHEKFLYPSMKKDLIKVGHLDLTPVTNHTNPWTSVLKDRKVLVVHPFSETIKQQYARRRLLFKNPDLLPDFELITLKAVQSVAGNGNLTKFKNWFEALNYMKEEVGRIQFEIAIIGCGAYGMPLAAHIKRIGKKAFHLGGETQIIFGIKGKRWEGSSYNYNNLFYNEYWIRPLLSDTPADIKKVEDGCYW